MASYLHRLYRRVRFGEPIIVVSGLPRSGTSMVMKMLDAGGFPIVMDGIRAADEDNPKGYYEHERVKNLAKERDKSWLAGARGKAVKIISYLLKELPPHYNYKVLFMRRDLREVLASQGKMLTRRGEPVGASDTRMMELFESDVWKVTFMMKRGPQFEVLDVHYKRVLEVPLEEARRIGAFLGRPLDTQAMAVVVDPQLYRNRADEGGT